MSPVFNPTANKFAPSSDQQNSKASQVGTPPFSPYLEARVVNLEEKHANLRDEVETLREFCHGLSSSVDQFKESRLPIHVGPSQNFDLKKSQQDAEQLSRDLENLKKEAHVPVNGDANVQNANGMDPIKDTGSVPPHLKASSVTSGGTVKKSLPPHLRGKTVDLSNGNGTQEHHVVSSANNRLATDGQVDHIFKHMPVPVPSSPASSAPGVQDQASFVENSSLETKAWKPYYIANLPKFTGQIPTDQTVSFHPDFLANTLGGEAWSPGLHFVKGKSTCILKNRTYYRLDPQNEPFLPKKAGDHGAKLTAFFNKAPEEVLLDIPDDHSNSYEDVPMFVLVNKRYVYFGNYTQTRWSDKLDYDTMMAHVPQHVKQYWAEELSASGREDWVTEELKKHFFRKPEYTGRLFAAPDDRTTLTSKKEMELTEKMTRDVKKYAEELREWEREANMKTAMIKKQFILDAFHASDADETPALRLWWEYLECVDYRRDFYDLLVQLQSRQEQLYFK
ncbi:hypothetical protein BDW02DRAFT_641949 [Decorospora gaudefroyi]|uniref:DUF6697 domain-containing protein n=1 Tax=Decorospora gaudefroyi TaxID=184978 RepID=A0A6A5JZP7_9PLEO|nr:hypothetical protein BDW02DRAFT_641949 [Decorospora gaudefroyi]